MSAESAIKIHKVETNQYEIEGTLYNEDNIENPEIEASVWNYPSQLYLALIEAIETCEGGGSVQI